MAKQKAAPEEAAERRYVLQLRRLDVLETTLRILIPWGCLVVIVYFSANAISALAGKATLADIGIRVLGTLKVSESVAYIFGAGGVFYGVRERNLRRDTVERLTKRTAELEQRLDPQRTSSKLTARGTTRPEDRR